MYGLLLIRLLLMFKAILFFLMFLSHIGNISYALVQGVVKGVIGTKECSFFEFVDKLVCFLLVQAVGIANIH
jgi:small-conductance mechanosensitive channel